MAASAAVITAAKAAVAAVQGVAEAPMWALTDQQVTETIVDIETAMCGLEALRASLIRLAEERQIPKSEGAPSTTAWFSSTTRVSKPAAARIVKTARLCDAGPVRAAWSAGIISGEQADIFRAALEGLAAPRRKRFTANRHALGVDDVMALPHQQRLGLAFLELIEHLPEGALPQAGGLAATVAVTVPVDVWRTGTGYGTSTGGTNMSAAQADRLSCNAHIVALYLDPDGKITCTSSPVRLYTKPQRLVMAARDRGCVWAGCDRPASHCEAHHLTPCSEAARRPCTTGLCSASSTTISSTKTMLSKAGAGNYEEPTMASSK